MSSSSGISEKINILIVDDKPANIVSLEAILSNSDYHLVTAISGSEALKHASQWDFAVILLDVMMPDMDGFELARLVKQNERSSSTPIIFLTAIATDFQYFQEGYAIGAVDYLQKPLDAAVVRAKVAVFVELYRKSMCIRQQEAQLREIQRQEHELRLDMAKQAYERHYSELAENIPQVILLFDPNGLATYINSRWSEITGMTKESSYLEEERDKVIHPHDVQTYKNFWHESLAAKRGFECELRVKSVADECYRWYLCRVLPEYSPDEEILGWIGTLIDIHVQKTAEHSQRFLAEISTVLASSYDYKANLSRVAQQLANTFGEHCAIDLSLPGKSDFNFVAKNDAKPFHLNLNGYLGPHAARQPPSDEAKIQESCGSDKVVIDGAKLSTLAKSPIILRGDVAGSITILSDREPIYYLDKSQLDFLAETSRYVAISLENVLLYHESQDANKHKDEFLAVLSHELRTPLNAILGWAELVRLDANDPAVLEGLEVIERNAKVLARLVADLLDVSSIITGKMKIKRSRVDVNNLISHLIFDMQPLAEKKDIALVFDHSDKMPVAIDGDMSRLQQAFWNLISNGIKFTNKGGTVAVSLDSQDSALKILVKDNGIGISQDLLPYVFDRFRQVDSSSTRRHGGLGLGLSIVKNVVELHGGSVSATSEGINCGTTFIVSLPLSHSKLESCIEKADNLQTTPVESFTSLQGASILLVDDDPGFRKIASSFLKQCGATVRVAGSVADAISILHQSIPQIVLTDIGMPDEDGYVMLDKLRQFEANVGQSIHAAAISAYASTDDVSKALDSGFEVYLTKPINGSELRSAVERLLRS